MAGILITGAGGMLGTYLMKQFPEDRVNTLGLRQEADFVCDLTKEVPTFGKATFDTVIHAAGTEENDKGMFLNLEGTEKLLKALEEAPPQNFVYISSHRVYSRDAGEGITEDTNTWATDEAGKSKALAEEALREWCGKRGVTLTIIRPARMFGKGVKGDTLTLFNDAISGKYIHIRGNDAKVSIVCALDVAKCIGKLYNRGGVYNISDGRPVKYIDMMEALTANAGSKRRMTHLPPSWAEWLWRLGRWIPSINRNLHPQVVEERLKSKIIENSLVVEATGVDFYDTIAVIERRDKNYPYED